MLGVVRTHDSVEVRANDKAFSPALVWNVDGDNITGLQTTTATGRIEIGGSVEIATTVWRAINVTHEEIGVVGH